MVPSVPCQRDPNGGVVIPGGIWRALPQSVPATTAFPSKEDTMRKWMTTIAIFGALCSCAGASHAREDELSGTWRGVVRKGAIETVVLFDFSRTEGGYRGNYWGAAPLRDAVPLAGIELGHSVRFEIPRLGVFQGELASGTIEGTYQDSQGGGSFHLEKQPDPDVARMAI